MSNITYEEAWETFEYDVTDGSLVWREDGHGHKAGDEVGYLSDHGSLKVFINGGHIQVARVIWLMWYEHLPDGFIEHINGDLRDNRIENLQIKTKMHQCRRGQHGDREQSNSGDL